MVSVQLGSEGFFIPSVLTGGGLGWKWREVDKLAVMKENGMKQHTQEEHVTRKAGMTRRDFVKTTTGAGLVMAAAT